GLEAHDFLADPEDGARVELERDVRGELDVDAVEAAFVTNRQASAVQREGRVAGREVAVTREDRAGVSPHRAGRRGRKLEAPRLRAVGPQGRESDAAPPTGEGCWLGGDSSACELVAAGGAEAVAWRVWVPALRA